MLTPNENNKPPVTPIVFSRNLLLVVALISLGGLSACGTVKHRANSEDSSPAPGVPAVAAEEPKGARDPFEGFNRAMYRFNTNADRYVLKPVAKGYRAIVPAPISKSISNFFSNLRDPANMLYNFLQGKPGAGFSDMGRFLINTTLGVAGLFDVATKMGMEKHNEDFGQTLAVWGVGEGPYLVLPFFGPSNLRDGPSLVVDWYTYPPNHVEDDRARYGLFALDVVDRRAQLLDAGDILEQAAGQDPYFFVREAFRQRRLSLIHDGNPPQPPPPPGLFEDDTPSPKPGGKKPAQ